MKITVIKKADVKTVPTAICPFIVEGVPESRK